MTAGDIHVALMFCIYSLKRSIYVSSVSWLEQVRR